MWIVVDWPNKGTEYDRSSHLDQGDIIGEGGFEVERVKNEFLHRVLDASSSQLMSANNDLINLRVVTANKSDMRNEITVMDLVLLRFM